MSAQVSLMLGAVLYPEENSPSTYDASLSLAICPLPAWLTLNPVMRQGFWPRSILAQVWPELKIQSHSELE